MVKIGVGDTAHRPAAVDHGMCIAHQALEVLNIFERAVKPLNRDSLEARPPQWRADERPYAPPFFYKLSSYRAADESGRPRQRDDAAHGFDFSGRASVNALRLIHFRCRIAGLCRLRNSSRAFERESFPEDVRGRVWGGTISMKQSTPKRSRIIPCKRWANFPCRVEFPSRHCTTMAAVSIPLGFSTENAHASLVLTSGNSSARCSKS